MKPIPALAALVALACLSILVYSALAMTRATPEEGTHFVAPEQLAPPVEIETTIAAAAALYEREWVLQDLRGHRMADGAPPTLVFMADGRVSGDSGCNRFAGTANFDPGGKLAFGPLMSTRRACVDEARNAQETRYLQALSQAAEWRAVNDLLYLTDAEGEDLMRFAAAGTD